MGTLFRKEYSGAETSIAHGDPLTLLIEVVSQYIYGVMSEEKSKFMKIHSLVNLDIFN